jgi:hypothetical protein
MRIFNIFFDIFVVRIRLDIYGYNIDNKNKGMESPITAYS